MIPTYSKENSYNIGDTAIKDGEALTCLNNIEAGEEFDSSKWRNVTHLTFDNVKKALKGGGEVHLVGDDGVRRIALTFSSIGLLLTNTLDGDVAIWNEEDIKDWEIAAIVLKDKDEVYVDIGNPYARPITKEEFKEFVAKADAFLPVDCNSEPIDGIPNGLYFEK